MNNNDTSTSSKLQNLNATFNISTHKKIIIAEIVGVIFCIAMSFVFHFAYDWMARPKYIAWLFATNESVWEHSKIIFYPFLIYSVIEYFILKSDNKVFLTAKCIPLTFCIPLMVTIFYTYSGIIGRNILAIDIIMTIGIIMTMFAISHIILRRSKVSKYYYIFVASTILIIFFLIIFTYFPPHIGLFYDKTKDMYGLQLNNYILSHIKKTTP